MNRRFSTRESVLLVVLMLMLMGVGYFKLIYEPIQNDIAAFQSAALNEQTEMTVNGPKLKKLRDMRAELDEIYASGNVQPIPSFDNSEVLMVELHTILENTLDYSLSFGEMTTLDGDYIVCRPMRLSYRTQGYAEARRVFDALHSSLNLNQISDVSMQIMNEKPAARKSADEAAESTEFEARIVQADLTVTFYEIDNHA